MSHVSASEKDMPLAEETASKYVLCPAGALEKTIPIIAADKTVNPIAAYHKNGEPIILFPHTKFDNPTTADGPAAFLYNRTHVKKNS